MLKIKNAVLLCASLLVSTHNAQANTTNYDSKQIECLTLNTYKESRGEPQKGQLAVIFTVLNRVKDSRFPSTPCKVISQPNQFVWWGKGKTIKEPKAYDKAKQLVHEVLEGKHKDVTYGAIYFNAHHKSPKNSKFTVRIGNHSFFK